MYRYRWIRISIPSNQKVRQKSSIEGHAKDTSDDDDYEQFCREIESVHNLNEGIDNSNRDMHIIFFEDWFISRNFVCIVMQYADGKCYDSSMLFFDFAHMICTTNVIYRHPIRIC